MLNVRTSHWSKQTNRLPQSNFGKEMLTCPGNRPTSLVQFNTLLPHWNVLPENTAAIMPRSANCWSDTRISSPNRSIKVWRRYGDSLQKWEGICGKVERRGKKKRNSWWDWQRRAVHILHGGSQAATFST